MWYKAILVGEADPNRFFPFYFETVSPRRVLPPSVVKQENALVEASILYVPTTYLMDMVD